MVFGFVTGVSTVTQLSFGFIGVDIDCATETAGCTTVGVDVDDATGWNMHIEMISLMNYILCWNVGVSTISFVLVWKFKNPYT